MLRMDQRSYKVNSLVFLTTPTQMPELCVIKLLKANFKITKLRPKSSMYHIHLSFFVINSFFKFAQPQLKFAKKNLKKN